VFRLKKDAKGEPQRYKARLVIKGYSQKRGIDYDEVYVPVARLTTIRTLLSVIHENNLHAMQMDVKNAFLHRKRKETIYMKVLDGINVKDGLVCKLNRSLYGLKQAPRVWNERFDTFVKRIHFKQSPHDRCLYINIQNRTKIYLLGPVAQYLRIYKLQNTSYKLLVISTNRLCCTIILVTVVNSAKFY
jgi:hypothetical protein